jgi:hypothetical protein
MLDFEYLMVVPTFNLCALCFIPARYPRVLAFEYKMRLTIPLCIHDSTMSFLLPAHLTRSQAEKHSEKRLIRSTLLLSSFSSNDARKKPGTKRYY